MATGGYARRLVFNPNKMEAFNGVFVDKLRQFGLIDHVVDHFDMTYPWHYITDAMMGCTTAELRRRCSGGTVALVTRLHS
ncbi:hypothetical protein E3N88_35458 [Mikania micrantha]|uniref:Uncharacterized protein n=1 Tax=Mikania micrantha TaxID=192012 RepID=A0A5N6M150_9ASTR|nr:hypothetical protein E3N88_35458 [Mikania micrantha]